MVRGAPVQHPRPTRVYAGVRSPEGFREPGVTTLRLDVTDEEQIAAAAAEASDATIVINNAGIAVGPDLLEGSLEGARRELEVNYLGTWAPGRSRGLSHRCSRPTAAERW